MGIGILPRGEQPRNTLKARKGMVAFNRKGAKAAERKSKSFRALQCLPKAVSVCSVAKQRNGTLLGSGGAQESGGWKPYHVGVQSVAFSVCSRPVLRRAHHRTPRCPAHRGVLWCARQAAGMRTRRSCGEYRIFLYTERVLWLSQFAAQALSHGSFGILCWNMV